MSLSEKDGIAVVGAGIIGLCTAYALRRAGHKVTVFDPNPPGSQCSAGNAGALSSRSVAPLAMPGILKTAVSMLLDPSSALHVPFSYWLQSAPWLAAFVRAAKPRRVRQIADALDLLLKSAVQAHTELAAEIGCPELVRRTGQLHIYPSEREYRKDSGSWELKRAHGLRFDPVDTAGIHELEPSIGPAYRHGVFLPDEGWMANPLRYAQMIAAALRGMDTPFISTAIGTMHRSENHWVLGDGARQWTAGKVVVCAGVWSRPLLAAQGHPVPLESQRGYHLNIEKPNIALSRVVVLADRKVFITPMETGLRMAGTVEFAGLERPLNRHRAMLLARHATTGLPDLSIDNPTVWMGHRPCLPDSLPVLGAVPDRENLWCAFGHGHLGLTGSVNTGRLIARAMSGRATHSELTPFLLDRFKPK